MKTYRDHEVEFAELANEMKLRGKSFVDNGFTYTWRDVPCEIEWNEVVSESEQEMWLRKVREYFGA